METIIHEIKDEEMPKHSMCLEGLRVKRYREKGGALQAMSVPASTPYSREEKEIDKEMKQFIYADEIHHPDHYTWKGTECKKVIELMTRGLSGVEAYYMGEHYQVFVPLSEEGHAGDGPCQGSTVHGISEGTFCKEGGKRTC